MPMSVAAKWFPASQRLGVRLATLMVVALLPLGIVAYLQTSNLTREAKGRSDEALMGATLRAALGEIRVISRAEGLVAGAAVTLPDLIKDNTACVNRLRKLASDMPELTLLSFVPENGRMTCSSSGESFDYSDVALFKTLITAREPTFTMTGEGPVSRTSVIGVLRPIFDAQGVYLGYLGAWVPHSRLRILEDKSGEADQNGVNFWSFNRDGEVLTASMGFDKVDETIPATRDLASFVGEKPRLFTSFSGAGERRTYATLPVVRNELYVMSSWINPPNANRSFLGVRPMVFPILMWVAGLVVSIWAAEMLVVRHVRSLNRSIASFAHGMRRHPDLVLKDAPLELREMAQAYAAMTDDIIRNEASLEDEVHQKEVLLREVHHRVKNNLQLIASIMNMQMRQARTPEAKGLLKSLQERVMSLATIHRGLYQTTGQSDVYANELLSDITRQTVALASAPGRQVKVDTDFDDILLTPDQAVPLSLLMTEALTNALKYARGVGGAVPTLSISMKRVDDGQVVLRIVNSIADHDATRDGEAMNTSTGLGAQLQMAFAQQIGGTLSQGQDGDSYRLEVIFRVSDLMKAENRAAAGTDPS
ncbi:sensor histidine kinase (plasmid) [Pseudorhodobacter turbinis]|uniref:histidine kinase n=1 Tax=Pseudorhodobacter turbinis TaxID=2500533 RepID=A0A4P8EJ47_9RHOB|nr:histidine kinase dimerization/phosphoacceptor domain -containing protein [Pseudorhodobacter turbinis]QCO57200.1 sensor histidine kinase [Pseudorhodobacter turbinis]